MPKKRTPKAIRVHGVNERFEDAAPRLPAPLPSPTRDTVTQTPDTKRQAAYDTIREPNWPSRPPAWKSNRSK